MLSTVFLLSGLFFDFHAGILRLATVTAQKNRRMVLVLAYVPERVENDRYDRVTDPGEGCDAGAADVIHFGPKSGKIT